MVNELIDWYNNSNLPKLIKIIIFNADFLMIHPFNDENGRMSRLIMNYMLIKEGYEFFKYTSLEKVILEHKKQYMLSLRTINNNWNSLECDYTKIISWFLDIYLICFNNYQQLIDLTNQYHNKLINKQEIIINILNDLNNRNYKINKNMIIKIINNLNINISEQMVKNVLSKLVKNKYLKQNGIGKSTWYEVINDLNKYH